MASKSFFTCFTILLFAAAASCQSYTLFDNGNFFPNSQLLVWPDNPVTTVCQIANSDWIIGVSDSSINWGGCGAFVTQGSAPIDLSSYTELDITAVLQSGDPNGNIQFKLELQDSNGNKGGIQIALIGAQAVIRYPLALFDSADLSKITGLLADVYEVQPGQVATITKIEAVKRDYFPVFNDDTSIAFNQPIGPDALYVWPCEPTTGCDPFYSDNTAPEGQYVLNVDPGTWGCGILNIPFNLEKAQSFSFMLKSDTDVLLEFTDSNNLKVSLTVPGSNGQWQSYSYPTSAITDQGLNLRTLGFQFMVTKVGSDQGELKLDDFRFNF